MEWGSVLVLVAGVALCTAHLGIGLALGWRMGQTRSASPPLSLDPVLASVAQVRADIGQLSTLSCEIPALDHEFAAILARLTLSLDELHRSLATPTPAQRTEAATPTSDERSHQMGTHAIDNARILEWFNRHVIGRRFPEESRRYPFAVKQSLAARVSEELPDPADFKVVQCHDLCPSQIRFLVDERPKTDEVVIGLGLPKPIKYLLAQVEDYRSVYMYGQVGFLVTANFVETVQGYQIDAATRNPQELAS